MIRSTCNAALLNVCLISACAVDPCSYTPIRGDYMLELEQLSSACLSQPPLPMPVRIEVQELGLISSQIFEATYSFVEQDRCGANVLVEKLDTNSRAYIKVAGDQLARDGSQLSGEVTIEFAMLERVPGDRSVSVDSPRTLLCEGTAQLTMRPAPQPQFRGLGEISALRKTGS
jgi:hypothetical protein